MGEGSHRLADGGDAASVPEELAEFVALFNAGRYMEGCEILQEVWGQNRANAFYKGLIQLAGAFDHLERGSLFWAEDLFASAYNLLAPYGPRHLGLEVAPLLEQVVAWHTAVAQARAERRPVAAPAAVQIQLQT